MPRALVNVVTRGYIELVAEGDTGHLIGAQADASEVWYGWMPMNTNEVTRQITSYFAPSSQAIAGILIRRLADGTPVSRSEAATLIGFDESELDAQLAALPFRVEVDDQDRIIGAGLTLWPTQHQFVIDGKRLYTWCAMDTLIFAMPIPSSVVSRRSSRTPSATPPPPTCGSN